jgi:diaminopimelate dehydrogenase
MPNYYADYDTEAEMKRDHSEYPHAGFVFASGKTGGSYKAITENRCEWGSNPEATGSILVAHARAAARQTSRCPPSCSRRRKSPWAMTGRTWSA